MKRACLIAALLLTSCVPLEHVSDQQWEREVQYQRNGGDAWQRCRTSACLGEVRR